MRHLDLGCTGEHGHGFAHGGAGGDHVLDDDDLVAVLGFIADQAAALAMILFFLAVEEKRAYQAVVARQGRRSGRHQRNALVGRAEHRVKPVTADSLTRAA